MEITRITGKKFIDSKDDDLVAILNYKYLMIQ